MSLPQLAKSDRDFILAAAIQAPSMHNTQPWLFRIRNLTIEVHRDPARELPAEDPDRRAILLSIGAVLFNIRVAAARFGRGTNLRFCPDPERPTLAAEVTLVSPDAGRSFGIASLYPQLGRRRTNRLPFQDRKVPERLRRGLCAAAFDEGSSLDWVDDPIRWLRILQLTVDAYYWEAADPERRAERDRWVGGERTEDGVPAASLGPRPSELHTPVRDLQPRAADDDFSVRRTARFESHPTIAVLSCRQDNPVDWLVAGQAMQRVMLLATANGLAVSLLNQALEHEELRPLVRDPGEWSVPVAILRFGYAPEVPATPRRPLDAFVIEPEEEKS